MLFSIELAFAPIGGRALRVLRSEEPVEDQPGVDLLGHRHICRPPGDVRRIGTAIARVAVARLRTALDAQLERGKPRLPADLLRGDLVDRDAHADAGPVGLERVRAGQEAGQRAGMVARPVAEGFRIVLGQAGQDEQIVLERRQRLERRRQCEAGPDLRWASSPADGRRWERRKTPCAGAGDRSLAELPAAAA